MTKLLAALDPGPGAKPVLATAMAIGGVVGAVVEPLYEPDTRGFEQLIRLAASEEVAVVVIGLRRTEARSRALRRSLGAVAASVGKPVAVVPPEAPASSTLWRVLVLVDPRLSALYAPRSAIRLAAGASLELVVLQVHDEIGNRTTYEKAQARELVRRFCPSGLESITLERRVGSAEEVVPHVARELGVDLIALGWAAPLEELRAPVVEATLSRAPIPLLLLPLQPASLRAVS
jgi:hypothetical protein